MTRELIRASMVGGQQTNGGHMNRLILLPALVIVLLGVSLCAIFAPPVLVGWTCKQGFPA